MYLYVFGHRFEFALLYILHNKTEKTCQLDFWWVLKHWKTIGEKEKRFQPPKLKSQVIASTSMLPRSKILFLLSIILYITIRMYMLLSDTYMEKKGSIISQFKTVY